MKAGVVVKHEAQPPGRAARGLAPAYLITSRVPAEGYHSSPFEATP